MFHTSGVVWAIAAAFAAVAAIRTGAGTGREPRRGGGCRRCAQLPTLAARAAVVALIARMRSLPVTLVAGIGVGLIEVVLQQNVDPSDLGVTDVC